MMKHTLTAAALAVVLASPAFAQSTTPSPTKPGATQSQMDNSSMSGSSTGSSMSGSSMSGSSTGASTSGQSSAMSATEANFLQSQQSTEWRGSKLIGASVYGQDNASIGEIDDVLVASDGKINAVVIGVGGFLGVGEKDVAVPFDKLTVTRKADSTSIDKITVTYTKDELKSAPKFAYYKAGSSTTGAATSDKNAPSSTTKK